jgi:peptidoglycan/LPS O-acetylase OafA/YrhL
MPPRGKADDVPFIHLLRGLAPLPVLWVHLYVQPFWLHERLDEVITLLRIAPGHLGVVIFFFVSGFVISHVAMVETRREFIIKRVFRIWPTLALAIVLTWVAKTVAASFGATPFASFSTASTAWHYVESLFFLDWMSAGGVPSKERPHALVIDWTLFIEVMFYGLVAVLIRPLRLAPAMATLAMIGVVALTSLAYTLDPAFLHVNYTSTVVLLIIVGRVFYLNWRGITSNRATLGLFVLSLGLYLALVLRLPLNSLLVPPYELLITYLVSAAIFFSVMRLGVRRVARPVRLLADISYAIYMLHVPVGISVVTAGRGLGVSAALSFALACLAVGAASWAVTRYLERPAQRLARQITSGYRE